jgi:hypothetical protein
MTWQPIAKVRGQPLFTPQERLARLSRLNDVTGCLEWTGTTRNGYGSLVIGSRLDGSRRTVRAHRLAYELHAGPIAPGMEVCHHCDNRRCIKVDHLFVGTKQDNMDDRERKGRNCLPPIRRGEAGTAAKLTYAQVLEIRLSQESSKKIAPRFSISPGQVRSIRRRECYLPPPPREGGGDE